MAKDSRTALQHFIAALENHHNALSVKRSDGEQALERAYELLESAFLDYEEALEESYEEYLPFVQAEDGE